MGLNPSVSSKFKSLLIASNFTKEKNKQKFGDMKNSPYICRTIREKKIKNISQLFREKKYKNL
jgi:hypothetical protein